MEGNNPQPKSELNRESVLSKAPIVPVLQTSIKDDTYPERAAAGLMFRVG